MGVHSAKRWSHVRIWPIIGLQNDNIDERLTGRITLRERDWFSEWWCIVPTRTCYFAKLRPCASIIVYLRFVCRPLLFCGYTVYSIQNYVVCSVAAEGDNVFEGVMVCFTQASSCGADRHPGGGVMAVSQGTIRVDTGPVRGGWWR